MSISLTDFRAKLNNLLGDIVDGTTTANGDENKKTFIDTQLAAYPDHWFAGKTAYLPDVPEARDVEDSLQPEGVIIVRNAFTSQVLSSVAYELHRFHPDKKKVAINQALYAAYPYLYKRLEDVSLTGTGDSDTEYDVPVAFSDRFPDQVWLKTTSSTLISFERFYDFDFKDVAGSKKFYADIATTKTILLIGKTWLTQFTNDASTTELTDEQAEVVALKAAANLYRMYSGIINAQDSSRFDELANRRDAEFEELIKRKRMPELYRLGLDWTWLDD